MPAAGVSATTSKRPLPTERVATGVFNKLLQLSRPSRCEKLAKRKLTPRQEILLEYFRANIWSNRPKAKAPRGRVCGAKFAEQNVTPSEVRPCTYSFQKEPGRSRVQDTFSKAFSEGLGGTAGAIHVALPANLIGGIGSRIRVELAPTRLAIGGPAVADIDCR